MKVFIYELLNNKLKVTEEVLVKDLKKQYSTKNNKLALIGIGETEEDAFKSLSLFVFSKSEYIKAKEFYTFWDLKDEFYAAMKILLNEFPEHGI